jgi:hypothetical protein
LPNSRPSFVDAELDVFLMTDAEYNEKLRSAMTRKPEH